MSAAAGTVMTSAPRSSGGSGFGSGSSGGSSGGGSRMTGLRAAFLLLLATTLGCAGSQGLHPDQLRNMLSREESRFVGSRTSQPPAVSSSRPAAPALGLYLKPTGFLHRQFEWTDGDRGAVLDWGKGLQTSGAAASAGFVPLSSLKGNSFTELKASAARYGVDLLVLIDGAAAVDRYNNYKAPLLYWTIFGAYFADGTQSDALCLVNGSVWDVKTGALLFSEEAEGRAQTVGPAALVDDDQVLLNARRQALAELLAKLKNRLAQPQNP
jgi:hypothetical protein